MLTETPLTTESVSRELASLGVKEFCLREGVLVITWDEVRRIKKEKGVEAWFSFAIRLSIEGWHIEPY